MPLHEARFDCEVLTPMFLAGADQSRPELRAPSLRGQLRWWFRAVCGGLCPDAKRVHQEEQRLFGAAGGNDSGHSLVTVRMLAGDVETNDVSPVPHRGFPFTGVKSFTPVRIILQALPSVRREAFDCAVAIFELFCALGGLGRRSRRAFGAMQPATWVFAGKEEVERCIIASISNAQRAMSAFVEGSASSIQTFEKGDLPTDFPILAAEAAQVHLGEACHWGKPNKKTGFVSDLMRKVHNDKQAGDLDKNVLGEVRPLRQASTMLVSVIEMSDQCITPVFTNFICDTAYNPSRSDFKYILGFPARTFDATRIF